MYKKKFTDLMTELYEKEPSERIIFDSRNKNSFVVTDEEEFRQCYDKKDKNRKLFARYYFLSNKGHLVSVAYGKLAYINNEQNERDGRGSYNLVLYDKNTDTYKPKRITAADLMAVVYSDKIKIWGKAKQIFEEKGIDAFGRIGKENSIQAHHIHHNRSVDELDNLEVVTTDRIHKILHQNNHSKPEEIKKMMDIILDEEPNRITLITADDCFKYITSVDGLMINEKVKKQFESFMDDYKVLWIYNSAVNILSAKFGKGFFEKPRYLYIDHRFFKVDSENELQPIELIETDSELSEKSFFVCELNEQNQTTIYFEEDEVKQIESN